ncbi:hypothetical protein [Streptomyces sp. JJ66]|uniref:hypothetical protein n=1 Tax=Streptomyces sp. JJ66 TaxID=2803843 RepID=UPI0027E2F39B|nr:hypothetical protein [Streptomyces sp. JJ66]
MLIRHLPRDSAVNLADHGEAAEWGVTEHLLAATVDHLAAANWMTATLHRDEDEEPLEYPDPVPRPGAAADGDPSAKPHDGPHPAAGEPADSDLTDPRQRAAPEGPPPATLARFFA